jgi:hypothetical protein
MPLLGVLGLIHERQSLVRAENVALVPADDLNMPLQRSQRSEQDQDPSTIVSLKQGRRFEWQSKAGYLSKALKNRDG